MAYVKTNWKDRVVERPNTYTMVDNGNGTITLTPVPGQIIERGTPLNAENLNKIEDAIVETNAQLSHKANELDLEVERQRINNFTSLQQGSTTGDAELIDARIGADGITYDTVGEAIRRQYSSLYDDIYSINKCENLMLSNVTLTDGIAIHSTGITYTSASSSACIDYLNINMFEKLEAIILNTYDGNYFVAFYDADKTFISRVALSKVGTSNLSKPSNAVFVRFSVPTEAKDEFSLKGITQLQLFISTSTRYVTDFNSLKTACENNDVKTIVLCNDITATSAFSIVGDKHIVANNFKITGNSSIEYLLTISEKKCIIDDLIISDANYNVICATGDCNLTLRNCEVFNCYNNDGVGVHGNADVFIYDCKIHDCRDEGLSSHGNSYCEIYNTHVYRNGWELGTDTPSNLSFGGLHLGGSRMGIIANCRAYKNTSHGIGFITIDNDYSADAECICYNNLCYDNDEAGICFGGATNIVCTNNSSYGNSSGIRFTKKNEHGNNGVIFGNNCFNNTTNYSIWSGADEGLIFDTKS